MSIQLITKYFILLLGMKLYTGAFKQYIRLAQLVSILLNIIMYLLAKVLSRMKAGKAVTYKLQRLMFIYFKFIKNELK